METDRVFNFLSYNFPQLEKTENDKKTRTDNQIKNLIIRLPNGNEIKMAIDERTPMMDILVYATAITGVSAGGMILVPTDKAPGYYQYKPNAPIGALACENFEVVPRGVVSGDRPFSKSKMSQLPFEPSIRIQIDLPQKQKTLLRLPPQTLLSDVLHKACEDANLGPPNKYEVRGANAHGYPLNLNLRLADVGTVNFVISAKETKMRKAQSEIIQQSNEEQTKKEKGCFRSLFNRKKKKRHKTLSEATTTRQQSAIISNHYHQQSALINEQSWPNINSMTSFQSIDPFAYQIPAEPSPPAPLPPSRSKRRPAPPPPNMEFRPISHSYSVSDYSNSLSPSPNLSAQYEGSSGLIFKGQGSDAPSYRSNILTTPYESIRTVNSSFPELSCVESVRSNVIKKRKAPPPPALTADGRQCREIEVQTNITLVKFRSSQTMLQEDELAAYEIIGDPSDPKEESNARSNNQSRPTSTSLPSNDVTESQVIRTIRSDNDPIDQPDQNRSLVIPSIAISPTIADRRQCFESIPKLEKSEERVKEQISIGNQPTTTQKNDGPRLRSAADQSMEKIRNGEIQMIGSPKGAVQTLDCPKKEVQTAGSSKLAVQTAISPKLEIQTLLEVQTPSASSKLQVLGCPKLGAQTMERQRKSSSSNAKKINTRASSSQQLSQTLASPSKKYLEPPVLKKATFQNGKRVDSANSLFVQNKNFLWGRKRTVSEQGNFEAKFGPQIRKEKEQNQRDQKSEKSISQSSAPVAPPPPPSLESMPKGGDQNTKPQFGDDRSDLMKAIREFGGTGKLRKVKNSQSR